jgi:hypothetical protein
MGSFVPPFLSIVAVKTVIPPKLSKLPECGWAGKQRKSIFFNSRYDSKLKAAPNRQASLFGIAAAARAAEIVTSLRAIRD